MKWEGKSMELRRKIRNLKRARRLRKLRADQDAAKHTAWTEELLKPRLEPKCTKPYDPAQARMDRDDRLAKGPW